MNVQNQRGTLQRLVRRMFQPREMAWAFGSGFWFALVTYLAGIAKERGTITPDTSAALVTVLGFGGFLLLISIQAWREIQREEHAASIQRLDGLQAEE